MALDLQQTEARDTVGTNILVSASAGAGKTSVLVARLVKRCLEDHVPVERIVALTFTKAAAEEMKTRLAASFQSALSTADDTQKAYIQDQIVALEDADILTIDSYCLKLLKKYYNVIGLDPIMCTQILDEGTRSYFLEEAFLQALEEYHEERPEETLQLVSYFSTRSEDYAALEKTISSIQDHANSCFHTEDFYVEAKKRYTPVHSLNDIDASILSGFYDSLLLPCELLQQFLTDMKQASEDDEKVKKDTLETAGACITNCQNALKDRKYALYLSTLENLALHIPSTGSKENTRYTSLRKKYTDTVSGMLENAWSEDILVHDANALIPVAHTLLDLTHRIQQLFQDKKRKEKTIDFTDMERFLLEILEANDSEVAMQLQDAYDEIMVDEFQDTSILQNAIIEKISNGHNVFRVGDVKQSIYRFRQAKPSLMQNLMKDPDQHCIHLIHNFRSRQSVVDFNNLLFSRLMNIHGFKDTYTDLDFQKIGSEAQEEKPVPAVFALVDHVPSLSSKQVKARWIAQKIVQLHAQGTPYRDCAVLVRAHSSKLPLKAAFEAYAIPYDMDTREGFFNSDLCKDIQSITKCMLDPSDPIALAALLTSPFYRFTASLLSNLKTEYGSLQAGVQKAYPSILEELRTLKEQAQRQGISSMLVSLAKLHGFYDALEDSSQTNFDFLLQKVQNTDIEDLYSFYRYLLQGTEEKSSEAMAKGKKEDLVRVVTIHQSKGLQYPIVFLFSDSQNTDKDASSLVQIHDEDYLGLRYIDLKYRVKRETVYSLAISHKCNLEDLEEFTRLVYVALTRAVERIYIVEDSSRIKTSASLSRASVAMRKGMSGLILSALQESPLFTIQETSLRDVPAGNEKKKEYRDVLDTYPETDRILPTVLTPSETEFTSIPSLDSTNEKGTSYGTRLHETIEALPNTVWTRDTLQSLPLSDTDKEKLIHFSDTPVYRSCLEKTIEKEMPFFVLDTEKNQAIKGAMDFVAYDEREVILIDFKTDNATKEEIKKRYTDQLQVYRRALHILYPDHFLTVYAYSFHNETYIPVD